MLASYHTRRLDLADTLMLRWYKASRTVYLGASRKSAAVGYWDEAQKRRIEERIRSDLQFDGYYVSIERMSPLDEFPLEKEFLWKIRIRSR